jgi:hypothetical protein
MHLEPRAFQAESDLPRFREFLRGRRRWTKLPDYWNVGKSASGTYVTLSEGAPSDHQLWEGEDGALHAYTWLTPGD